MKELEMHNGSVTDANTTGLPECPECDRTLVHSINHIAKDPTDGRTIYACLACNERYEVPE